MKTPTAAAPNHSRGTAAAPKPKMSPEVMADRRAAAKAERDAERRELANEAGMLGGCDAYNDMMGWGK